MAYQYFASGSGLGDQGCRPLQKEKYRVVTLSRRYRSFGHVCDNGNGDSFFDL